MRTVQKILVGMVLFLLSREAGAVAALQVRDTYQEDGRATIRVEGVLKGSPEKIWNDLVRFNDYSKFMPHVTESFFISETGVQKIREAMKETMNANKIRNVAKPYRIDVVQRKNTSWDGLVFMVLDTPFPVENRWYVIRTTQDESRASENIYKRCWNLVIGNIESAKGCWHLGPSGDGSETSARYEDNVNPGGHVPQWVSRMAAHETMPDVFRTLEKRAVADLQRE